ncbi:MAG: hypothetical protein ACXACU_17085 [Candidatus Hodarchaeales archaeon]
MSGKKPEVLGNPEYVTDFKQKYGYSITELVFMRDKAIEGLGVAPNDTKDIWRKRLRQIRLLIDYFWAEFDKQII